MFLAAFGGHADVVDILIQNNADVSIDDCTSFTYNLLCVCCEYDIQLLFSQKQTYNILKINMAFKHSI